MASPGNPKSPGERSGFTPTTTSRSFSRHVSTRSRSPWQQKEEKYGWGKVKDSIKTGTLQFVGLKPYKEEERHWEAVQGSIYGSRFRKAKSPSPSVQSFQPPSAGGAPFRPQPSMRTSLKPQDAAAVRAITGASLTPAEQPPLSPPPYDTGRIESDHETPVSPTARHPSFKHSYSAPAYAKQASVFSMTTKGTGRTQVFKKELKPDLWKIAVKGVYRQISQKREVPPVVTVTDTAPKSFFLDEEDEEEEGVEEVDTGISPSPTSQLRTLDVIPEQDEDFFGLDEPPVEEVDSAVPGGIPSVALAARVYKPKPPIREAAPPLVEKKRRRKVDLKDITLSGGYVRGYGGLGLPTLLLQFKYKDCIDQRVLDKELLHKRPYFTYWLMVVHILIMIIALSVYGFAPYGWDLREQRESVLQSNLAVSTVPRFVVPNVWGGPSQQSLVTLGALFAPCMRFDRQLFDGINSDRRREANSSGCCIMRDQSGCFQTLQESEGTIACQPRFSDFVTEFNQSGNTPIRAVCGTSPTTCDNPSPEQFVGGWVPNNTLTWPICLNDTIDDASPNHLTCELTGRPCCFGIQAHCLITTAEHCEFLDGSFHSDAFLCSQVDCLNDVCGLLEFLKPNDPDQVYRLWIALFLHAGLIHLLFSVIFSFFVLRHVEKRLGWLRTAFVYILSGIGGNLVSAYFVPYNPAVGPAGSILGIVAYFFVFLIFESRFLEKPWLEFLKLLGVAVAFFLVGLLPFIDNFAHIGGFVFGFLLSGIIVPYGNYKKVWDEIPELNEGKMEKKFNAFYIIKLVMVVGGIPTVLALYLLFFLLFYLLQDTWNGFSFLTCIPFTDTICTDMSTVIRDRNASMPII